MRRRRSEVAAAVRMQLLPEHLPGLLHPLAHVAFGDGKLIGDLAVTQSPVDQELHRLAQPSRQLLDRALETGDQLAGQQGLLGIGRVLPAGQLTALVELLQALACTLPVHVHTDVVREPGQPGRQVVNAIGKMAVPGKGKGRRPAERLLGIVPATAHPGETATVDRARATLPGSGKLAGSVGVLPGAAARCSLPLPLLRQHP